MDMNNVKSIYDNSVGKEVKKIQDANGNIIWYKVPDGYRKVEYLESSGTQYFDSGIEAKYSVGIYTKFQCLSKVNSALCGAINNITAGYNNRHHLSPYGSQISYWYTKNSKVISPTIRDSINVTAINTFYLNPATGVYKVNNSTGHFTALQGTVGCNYGIFGRLSDTLAMQDRPVKVYWFIMMEDNIVVRHFIPVVRNADDTPGMYDLVNDVFYTNAGAGEFTWKEMGGNLFLGFDSPWCCNFSITIGNGKISSNGDNRATYFFSVKPNTTYRYTATTTGDRFAIYALTVEHNAPPTFQSISIPYGDANVNIIKNNNYDASITDYTFTTGPDDKMVYIYLALSVRPTGVRIVEV